MAARSSAPYPRDPAYLAQKVPPRDASIRAGVEAPVAVRWDVWGIPHIRAETPHDLFFALGYVTAQECLWRLDYCRRQARGQLAAILGRDALASDRAMRTLGLGRHADALAAQLVGEEAQALDAYAAGVNHWLQHAIQQRLLPVEFDWLGYEPTPWTPADSIACWKHRWWTLTGRLDTIAAGEAARRHLPPPLLDAFMATELAEESIVPSDDARDQDAGSAGREGAAPGGGDDGTGSNNWAVSGRRTTTGYPVLCSDPHNPFGQPSQWFQAHLALADGSFDAAGATYAGWPGVYIGRNRHVAWGFTNHVASTRDLYVETVDPSHPGRYRQGAEWLPFDVEQHTIEVSGEAPERFEVRRTRRGPIANSLFTPVGGDEPPISLRWTGLEVGAGLEPLLALNRATSVAEALAALARWPCPVLNGLVADDGGRIAYHVAGLVPRRREAARRFRDAQNPDDAWQGYIPFDDLPQLIDPPRGWLATANQPPWRRDPPGLSYLPGGAWADGGRMRRIRQRLTEKERLSPQELGSIQADVTGARAVELLPAVLRHLAASRQPAPCLAASVLEGWDGRFVLGTAAPTVWVAFWEAWLRRVAAARFPQELVALAATQAGAVARRLLLGDDTSPPWFAREDVGTAVESAIVDAVDGLSRRFGPDPAAWQWGQVHTVTWQHPLSTHGPADRRAAAALFDVGPYPCTGGPTVRAAGYSTARPYRVVSGATYRMVADLSPGGAMLATSTTGQSGHPASPHYADQARLWLEDQYHPLRLDPPDADLEGITHLLPA